jgi:hypothetical protein
MLSIKLKSIIVLLLLLPSFVLASAIRTNSNLCSNQIKIKINFPVTKVAYALKETLPSGLTPFHITQNGIWNKSQNCILWGSYSDQLNREFSYQVFGEENEYTFDGTISIDGISQAISGDKTLKLNHCSLSFITTKPDPAQKSIFYTFQFSIQSGIYPYEFINIQGSFPPDITLDSSTGTISGIPLQTGQYTFKLSVTDGENTQVEQFFTIDITQPLAINNGHLPNVCHNTDSTISLQARGGQAPYTFSVHSGELPTGIQLTEQGQLIGTFSKTGKYEFTFQVFDTYNNSINKTFTLNVIDPNLYGQATRNIVTENCTNLVTIQTDFVYEIGGYGLKEKLPKNLVPFNISHNGYWNEINHCIIWGAFTDRQNRELSYQLSGIEETYRLDGIISIDGIPQMVSGDQSFTPVDCPLTLISTSIPPALSGVAYLFQINVQGGRFPFEYTITEGSFPAKLSLNTSNGNISGIPAQKGEYAFKILIQDALNDFTAQDYVLQITDPYDFTTDHQVNFYQHSDSAIILSTESAVQPITYSLLSGDLPPGIILETDGNLTGSFNTSGTFIFTIQSQDATNAIHHHNFVINVLDPNVYGNAERKIHTDECANHITIASTFSSHEGGYAIKEILPEGLLPTNISHNGVWNDRKSCIVWGAFTDKMNRELSYQISGIVQEYSVKGIISINGMTVPVEGDHDLNQTLCPLNFVTVNIDAAQVNVPYKQQLIVEGGMQPYQFHLTSGILPPGVLLDSQKGILSGRPTKAGSQTIYISCIDQGNMEVEREFILEVTEKLVFISQNELPHATEHLDYFFPIQLSGGKAPFVFSLGSGNLPKGLTIQENGVLSGKISQAEEYEFTVNVTDRNNNVIQQTFSLLTCSPLMIQNERLYDGIVGEPYEFTLNASGGYGDYQWMVYSGILPSGLQLDDQQGLITGKPDHSLFSTLVILLTDTDNRKTFKDFTFKVAEPLAFASDSLPNALKNEQYSEIIRVTGGIGPYTYDHLGRLPDGLSLDSVKGLISGKSSIGGSANIFVTVLDSTWPAPQEIGQYLKLRTTSMLTILTTSVLPHARRGHEINTFALEAAGAPSPYTWQIIDGLLPDGITLDSQTGMLSGMPSGWGDFLVKIEVTNTSGQTADKEFIWHIMDILTITSGLLPDAAEDAIYNFSLQAKGGLKPYQWRLNNTSLPESLSLNNQTGTISGIPDSQSARAIVIEVSDSDDPPQTVQKEFHLEIIPKALYIFTPELPDCLVNNPYYAEIKALEGKPPYSWNLKSGNLPAGLEILVSHDSLKIEGTPTQTGLYTFTIEVTDSHTPPNHAEKTFNIEISGNVEIITRQLPHAQTGNMYASALQAKGGLPAYIWRITDGKLPAGLTLNARTGDITGIPEENTSESEEFRIQVQDSANPSSSAETTLSIYVILPLQIVTEIIPDAIQYRRYVTELEIFGGIQPYLFKISNGILPEGLSLDEMWGILSGFPKQEGLFTFTVQLTDTSSPPFVKSYDYMIKVYPGTPPVLVTGDLNADESLEISDAILALQILTNCRGVPVYMDSDIYMDELIDMIDVLMIMQALSK